LLSLFGGAAGLALAYGLWVLNSRFGHVAGAPIEPDLAVDWRAALFAFALAVLCGIGFSLAPALQATSAEVASALKAGSALELSGYRRFGLRNLAMVAQLAGSLMLLLITGFLVVGISRANNIETKLDPKKTVLLSIDPVRDGYSPENARALFQRLPERLRVSGLVSSFAMAAEPPFPAKDPDDDGNKHFSAQESQVQKSVVTETVGSGYFAALNEPMRSGREFEERDQRQRADGSNAVVAPAILNESAAKGFFGAGNAIGKRITDGVQSYEVVGVIHDLKDVGGVVQPTAYMPLTEADFARPPAGGITLLVRTNGGPNAVTAIQSAITANDPKLTVFNVQTLNEYLERSRFGMRSAMRTYGGMGVFGLVLSAIGLAGVTAYAVAQRRREIGIRMALGARKTQVLRLVLREGTALVAVGTALGFAGAVILAKALSAVTSTFADALKVGTNDPLLLVGAPLLLAAVATLACCVPARRATKIEPLRALRQD
jgi:putative ABC transport system permease protein